MLPSPFRSTCGSYADAPVQMPAMTAGRFGNYWPFEGCHATLRGAELSIAGHFATSLSDRTSCCSFRNPFGPEVHARSPPPSGFMTWLVGLVRQIWKHKTLKGNLAKRFSLFFFRDDSADILTRWGLLTGGKTIFTWQVSMKICWISPTCDVKRLCGVFTRVLWENEQSTYLIVYIHVYTGACKQELIFVDWVAKNDDWCSAKSVQG